MISELRIELQLPFTGQFKYPDLFPSLSLPSSSELQPLDVGITSPEGFTSSHMLSPWSPAAWQSSPGAISTQTTSRDGLLQPEEERSWLYYLAEISLRSIMNRVLTDLYSDGEDSWKTAANRLARREEVYVEELEQWHAALPPQLIFANPLVAQGQGQSIPAPDNELSFLLQTRFAGVSEWIYRPSLYIVLHSPRGTVHGSHILATASKAVEASATVVRLVSTHHRHGGIWGLLRRSFGASLVLMMVAMHSHGESQFGLMSETQPPSDWVQLVELCMMTIRRWASPGSTDLARMEEMLRKLLDSVVTSIGAG